MYPKKLGGRNKSLEDNDGLDDVDMQEVERYLKEYEFPVHKACHNRAETKIIKYLAENTQQGELTVNKMDSLSRFALHYACDRHPASLDVIKYLVEKVPQGESILKKGDHKRNTPLHLACAGGSSVHVIEYLVKEGNTAVNKPNERLQYPLHLACGGCSFLRFGVIKCLVDNGNKEIILSKQDTGFAPIDLARVSTDSRLFRCVVEYLQNTLDILDLEERARAKEVLAEQESIKKQLKGQIAGYQGQDQKRKRETDWNHLYDILADARKETKRRKQEMFDELQKQKVFDELQKQKAGTLLDERPFPPRSHDDRTKQRSEDTAMQDEGKEKRQQEQIERQGPEESATEGQGKNRKRETEREYLSNILVGLWNDGVMSGKTRLTEIPFPERFKKKNKKKGYFTALMELCDLVLLEGDRRILFKRVVNKSVADYPTVNEKAAKIQDRAFKMMQQLDGQTAEQLQPTYALGKRYYEWLEMNSPPSPLDAGRAHSIGDHGRSASKSEARSSNSIGSHQVPQIGEKDSTNPPDLTNPPNSKANFEQVADLATDPLQLLQADHARQDHARQTTVEAMEQAVTDFLFKNPPAQPNALSAGDRQNAKFSKQTAGDFLFKNPPAQTNALSAGDRQNAKFSKQTAGGTSFDSVSTSTSLDSVSFETLLKGSGRFSLRDGLSSFTSLNSVALSSSSIGFHLSKDLTNPPS